MLDKHYLSTLSVSRSAYEGVGSCTTILTSQTTIMADSVEGPHVIIVVKLHLSTNPLNSVESLPSMAAAALAHVGKAKSKG